MAYCIYFDHGNLFYFSHSIDRAGVRVTRAPIEFMGIGTTLHILLEEYIKYRLPKLAYFEPNYCTKLMNSEEHTIGFKLFIKHQYPEYLI